MGKDDGMTRKFPELRYEMRFEFNACSELSVAFHSWDSTNYDEYDLKIERQYDSYENGRWRLTGGHLVSKQTLGSRLFTFDENPSDDECEFMSSFFDMLGKIADAIRLAHLLKPEVKRLPPKDYFANVSGVIVAPKERDHVVYEKQKSFLYLMKHANGLTKIGISCNPRAREKTLQAEDPRLDLFFCCEKKGYTKFLRTYVFAANGLS